MVKGIEKMPKKGGREMNRYRNRGTLWGKNEMKIMMHT